MAITVLAAAPSALLSSLGTVKAELGMGDTDTANDAVLFGMLTRASSVIAKECGRVFGVQTQTETLRGTNSQLLALTNAPILHVTQVLEDTAVVDPTNPDTGYSIEDAEAGALYRRGGWGGSVGLPSWGSEAYGSGYILSGGTQAQRYSVTYTSGYLLPARLDDQTYNPPPLPGALEQACLQTVRAWWFTRQSDPAVTSEKTRSQQVTYDRSLIDGMVLPKSALGLLRDYRRVVA